MRLRKRRILLVETEATPGTAETLVAADGVMNVYNAMIQPSIDVERREGQGQYAEDLSGVSGQRTGTCTFQTDIFWDGTSTEPFWATELLPACGWVLTTNTFNNILEPPGSNQKTLTLAIDEIEGATSVRKQIRGAVGNFRIVLPTGRRAYIEWTFQGVWDTPTDTGAILAPTYNTDAIIKYSSATTTFNSNNLCVDQFEWNSGNVLTPKECPDNAAGIDYFLISDRTITATASPESTTVASADHYGDLISHTAAALVTTLDGTGTGTLAITAAKAQVQSIQEADRNGVVVDNITWQCNKNGSTDQESLTFVFTPSA